MNIVKGWPPNIDQIDAAFKVRGQKGLIFTFGGTVYVPDGGNLHAALRAHEGAHSGRQTTDWKKIEEWWTSYCEDPKFRLNEERIAHRAEYKEFCNQYTDRNYRARYLQKIAQRFASPLYGGLVTVAEAKRFITEAR